MAWLVGLAASSARPEDPQERPPKQPWIQRWAPEKHMVELGGFAAARWWSPRLSLLVPEPEALEFTSLAFGVRMAYLPSRHFGIEVDGEYSPTRSRTAWRPANVWRAGGHLIAQLGLRSVVPYVLVGGGVLGLDSSAPITGSTWSPTVHFGGGLKLFLSRHIALRFEGRDTLNIDRERGLSHSPTINAGLSLTLGRRRAKPPSPQPTHAIPQTQTPLPDYDSDEIADLYDACPKQRGVAPLGCPTTTPPIIASPTQPPPIADDDRLRNRDECPSEAETLNHYLDDDGCPDTLPDELLALTGVVDGVQFEVSRKQLDRTAQQKLAHIASILARYPSVRIEISGHTDSTGDDELNQRLSLARAEVVKAALIDGGVQADRLETRGAGAFEPIDSNRTSRGRHRNRRIEFRTID